MSIEYINHEVSLRLNSDLESQDSAKDLILELKQENHVHPNIVFYLFITCLIILLIALSVYIVKYRKNIRPYSNRRPATQIQIPTANNEIQLQQELQRFREQREQNPPNEFGPKLYPHLSTLPTTVVPV